MTTEAEKPGLRRDLGLLQASALAITDMIGIGPFIAIPLLIATMGGPQAMIGWLLGALLAFFDGLVWAELGAAMPKAGGSYQYLRESFGPMTGGRWFSFLMVWQITFSAPLSVASGSIGFANYCHFLIPSLSPWGVRILAAMVPLFLVAVLYRKIGALGRLSVVLLAGVLVGCLWIVISGLPHLSAARLLDFPPSAFKLNWLFWMGLGHSTLYGLYCYWGYYNVCYLGAEIRQPERVIPRAILISIGVVGTLYILMTASILSVIPWRQVRESSFVVSTYIQKLQGTTAANVITVLILWIAFSSVFSLLLGYSRIPYAAAADGNFFKIFARLHPRGNFPHISLLTLGVIASIFSLGHLPDVIGSLVATRVLIQYLPQTIGFFVLRFRAPELARPFRMWLYPLPGLISVLGWIYILATSARKSLIFALAVFILGSLTFFARSRIHGEWPFIRS
ncbi:MAG TPA: APC family permease [Acidobacteriota bacterium]|nr:APC family permease [Acidobacteriota bacterium]